MIAPLARSLVETIFGKGVVIRAGRVAVRAKTKYNNMDHMDKGF